MNNHFILIEFSCLLQIYTTEIIKSCVIIMKYELPLLTTRGCHNQSSTQINSHIAHKIGRFIIFKNTKFVRNPAIVRRKKSMLTEEIFLRDIKKATKSHLMIC